MSGALKTKDVARDEANFIDCIKGYCMAWQPPYDDTEINYHGTNGTYHQPTYHHEGYCKIIDPKGVAFKPSDIVTVGARGLDDPLYSDITVGRGGSGINFQRDFPGGLK